MSGAFDAGSVISRLILDVEEWHGNIEKAKADAHSLGAVVEKNKKLIEDTGKALAVAGGAIVAALGVAIKKTADYGDELWKTSQKTGIAVETLGALKLAADKSDLSLETLASSLAKMSRSMSEAYQGGKEYREIWDRIGVTITDNTGKLRPMDDVLGDVADKFAKMPPGAEKSALAMDLFGRSGAQMIPLLNLGREGLKAEREEAERLGLILSEKAAKDSEKFNDQLTTLSRSVQGVGMVLGQALIPLLTGAADAFTSVVTVVRKALDFFPPLGNTLTVVAGTFGALALAVGPLLLALPKILEVKQKLSALVPVLNARLATMKLSLGTVALAFAAVTLAAEATSFAFKKVHEAQDRAMGEIKKSAEESAKGWKFAQASIRGETDITAEEMKRIVTRLREMGQSSEQVGSTIAQMFRLKIAAAAKAAAVDTTEVAAKMVELQAEVADKIKSLTLNEFDYRISQAARWRDDIIAKSKDSVNAAAVAAEAEKAYALEVGKIRKEQAEAAAEAEKKSFEGLVAMAQRLVKPVTDSFGRMGKGVEKVNQDFVSHVRGSVGEVAKWAQGATAKTDAFVIDTGKKTKKSFSDVASSINQTIQVLQQGFGQFFSGLNQLSQQRYQAEMKRMDEEYQAEKKRIEESTLSEEEKAKKLEALDAEYAAKKKAAEIKQAEANKKSSLMQAIVNTALAVTSALSMKPFFPLGLIAAAAALAAGYIQVRVIQNQQVPAMAEGGLVRQPTHILAGEAGPEAILPMRELRRMLGTDRKGGVGSRSVHVTIQAIDTRGMESYTRRSIIPEITRAMKREALVVPVGAVR